MMRARRQLIKNIIDTARERQSEATENNNLANRYLTNAKAKAASIMSDAQREAEAKKLIILDQARLDVARMNEVAQETIAREHEAMQEAVRESIIEVSWQATTAVLGQELDRKRHDQLIDEFIKEV